MEDATFFEELARERAVNEEEFEIGVAKAKLTPAEPKGAPPKRPVKNEPEGTLTLDVYQTPTDIVVKSAVAGVKPEDLDITATNDSITIKGERLHDEEIAEGDYFYRECYWGRFSRSVILPQEVDPEGAVVRYKEGILSITLPKVRREKTKRLNVKTD